MSVWQLLALAVQLLHEGRRAGDLFVSRLCHVPLGKACWMLYHLDVVVVFEVV